MAINAMDPQDIPAPTAEQRTRIELRALRKDMIESHYIAMAKEAAFIKRLSEAYAAEEVPVGSGIDLLGDGKVKPDAECRKDIERP